MATTIIRLLLLHLVAKLARLRAELSEKDIVIHRLEEQGKLDAVLEG